MAKIVPQGYANINAYDESDNFFKLLEYIDRYGANLESRKNQTLNYTNEGYNDLLPLIDRISSEESLAAIETSFGALSERTKEINNPMLGVKSEAVGAVINDKRKQFNAYKKGMQDIVNEYGSTTSILNPSMLKDNWDQIENIGFEKMGDYLSKLNSMTSAITGADGNLLFPNYSHGDVSGSDILRMKSEMTNLAHNLRNSLDSEGIVSKNEFDYLLIAGTEPEIMDKHRKEVTDLSKTKIGNLNRLSVGIDKAFFTLNNNENKTLYRIYQDSQDEEGDIFSNWQTSGLDMNNEVDAQMALDYTVGSIRNGKYIDENGLEVDVPAKVISAFKEWEDKLVKQRIMYDTQSAKEERRFNFWSPFPYSSTEALEMPKGNYSSTDYGDTDGTDVNKDGNIDVLDKVQEVINRRASETPDSTDVSIDDLITSQFGGNKQDFLEKVDFLGTKAQDGSLAPDEQAWLDYYAPHIASYIKKSESPDSTNVGTDSTNVVNEVEDKASNTTQQYTEGETQYEITPDSPWDLIDSHIAKGGKGVDFDSLIKQMEGQDAKSVSTKANRKWVIKALQTNGYTASAARTKANKIFPLLRKYYNVKGMKSGSRRDTEMQKIRQEYQNIIGDISSKEINTPSLNLYDRFFGE